MDNKLVRIREAARRLGVSHSTIVRQMQSGQIPNRGSPRRPLVSMHDVLRAREDNVNAFKSGNWAGLFAGQDGAGAASPPAAPPPAAPPPAAPAEAFPPLDLPYGGSEEGEDEGARGPSLNDVRKADLSVQFRLRQLQLKEREGELVSAAAARLQQQAMARRVRDAVLALPETVAEELASMSDPGAIEERLETALRQILQDLGEAMAAEAGELDHDA